MANEQLKQLGYEQIDEPFCDQPGITETQTIKIFRHKKNGDVILVLHRYGPESADRYFQEVPLTALQPAAGKYDQAK
jgi:hypothetical protein